MLKTVKTRTKVGSSAGSGALILSVDDIDTIDITVVSGYFHSYITKYTMEEAQNNVAVEYITLALTSTVDASYDLKQYHNSDYKTFYVVTNSQLICDITRTV